MKRYALLALLALPLAAQGPMMAPPELDNLVQRIALYPDPLLAQVLTASTYWDQIPEAAGWANQHSYLTGDALARAIDEDRLPWDPSVLALLPFPSVLQMMASDPGWTQALGTAVLNQRPDVMDAVQRERRLAMSYGYLQSGPYYNVVGGPYIQILPVTPGLIVVPRYNPVVVFTRPRPGFAIGAAISFGPRVSIGAFVPFGWRAPAFNWGAHAVIIDNRPWERGWVNRERYAHPYAAPVRRFEGPRRESHEHERGRH
ncbi:MAG TPA: DUF3300 domain-containing protein [Bryobacteraceae bacterium]|jgi:hypothetical protein|nr:DUF3300 domain-containing protein [Bryobacteraceae bacterium]